MIESLGKAAKSALSVVAPVAASMFGGPLAGTAVTAVLKGLGLSPETSKEELEATLLQASPETLLKLKEMEAQLTKDLATLNIDLERIHAEDRHSARRREVETQDWTPRLIAFLVIGLYMSITYIIFVGHTIHEDMEIYAMRSLGTMDAILGMVIAYYFGSTARSKEKDKIIDHLTSKNGQ